MTRSGDDAVVSLCNQWYLDYGNEEWKAKTREALAKLNIATEVSFLVAAVWSGGALSTFWCWLSGKSACPPHGWSGSTPDLAPLQLGSRRTNYPRAVRHTQYHPKPPWMEGRRFPFRPCCLVALMGFVVVASLILKRIPSPCVGPKQHRGDAGLAP